MIMLYKYHEQSINIFTNLSMVIMRIKKTGCLTWIFMNLSKMTRKSMCDTRVSQHGVHAQIHVYYVL